MDEKGAQFVYGLINSALRDAPELGIDFFDVTAISDRDSMARAAADYAAQRAARAPQSLGGVVESFSRDILLLRSSPAVVRVLLRMSSARS